MSGEQPRSRTRVYVLYEDSRGPTNGFGLHKLVLATTHDMLGEDGSAIPRHVLTPPTARPAESHVLP